MIANRRSALWLAALACKAWAGTAHPAGVSTAIRLRVDTHGRNMCGDIPLLSAAWNSLPPEQGFPCDSDHLVVILDYEAFLKGHAGLSRNTTLRERARHAFAFTITAAWPIYINLGPHQAIADAFDRSQPWIAFAVAGVLAHEKTHAMGDLSEAAGLLAEWQLDQRFQSEGKLPKLFDIRGLERQYREVLGQENALSQENQRRSQLPRPTP